MAIPRIMVAMKTLAELPIEREIVAKPKIKSESTISSSFEILRNSFV
jgi:hypothetical protein